MHLQNDVAAAFKGLNGGTNKLMEIHTWKLNFRQDGRIHYGDYRRIHTEYVIRDW